jgi:hypothetical protein
MALAFTLPADPGRPPFGGVVALIGAWKWFESLSKRNAVRSKSLLSPSCWYRVGHRPFAKVPVNARKWRILALASRSLKRRNPPKGEILVED